MVFSASKRYQRFTEINSSQTMHTLVHTGFLKVDPISLLSAFSDGIIFLKNFLIARLSYSKHHKC